MAAKEFVSWLGERPPFSWFASSEVNQFLMLGLEDAGKTTLLYKLKIPGWQQTEIIRDMHRLKKEYPSKDPSYHYEEMSASQMPRYGVWEVPGNEVSMRMWPMFYRYLRIDAVFFVVDNFSADRDNIDKLVRAREQMEILLNEDELRTSAFVLVLNSPTPDSEERKESEAEHARVLLEMLGAYEHEQATAHRDRFYRVSFNCADVSRQGPEWEKILKDIREVYNRIGQGSRLR
mmetsp:Transcript_19499/g.51619  ORF Transcript_19499/g.51619 Transcript_19499/m.51619 type:complete len:233 (-) Transcript_19499:103-801(-)